MRPGLRWKAIGVLVAVVALVAGTADAGAGRSRPGGSGRSGGSSGKVSVGGKASYGHGGYRGGHGHHGYGYGYGHGYGYGYGIYGHYGWGYPYLWPYWGGWYVPTRYVFVGGDRDELPGTLETDVKPGKAEVRVDGEYVGQARDYNGRWDRLWLAPGDHDVEFTRDGYRTLRVHVKIRPGGYAHVSERLEKGEGLDPRSSEPREIVARTAPRREAEARSEPEFEIAQGSLRRGLLRIAVDPADAAVYLDGEFLARGEELDRLHGAIPVARGVHSVEVVRPGYRGRTVDVEVTGDEPVKLRIELERDRGD